MSASHSEEKIFDLHLQAGRCLANPSPGEEIVISGISGRFPESDTLHEYRDNLANKVNLITINNKRWNPVNPDIPHHTGKLKSIEKFDSGFFGISSTQAKAMDPMVRLVLECAIEAIFDAGVNPRELEGTRTGVFIGTSFSETQKIWLFDNLDSSRFGFIGCVRSMQTQWISYILKLNGPTNTCDSACSSSLYALECAYKSIREDRCDAALVGGTNLCLSPFLARQFARLGVLSPKGKCSPFDEDGDGYVRSETVSVIFLQKMKNSRRVYAQIVHCKSNCDGFKEQGITYPSGLAQKQLITEVYQECNVDPNTIDYVEAHATGTQAGDPEEIAAIDDVYCEKRPNPLPIGCVKSNMGHSETASGMCAIAKVVLNMEHDCLFPNINFKSARITLKALNDGRLTVVTDQIEWPKNGSGFVGLNNFGFGGANCHMLLKRNSKEKIDGGVPKDDIPRLVCVSGRHGASIDYIFDYIKRGTLDSELVRLLHEIFSKTVPGHTYRGYTILTKKNELGRSFKRFDQIRQPLSLITSISNTALLNIGRKLLSIPLFDSFIQNIQTILLSYGIKMQNGIEESVFGCISVQIALINVLKSLGIVINCAFGHSIGKIFDDYVNNRLTLNQTILCSYYIGKYLEENEPAHHGVHEIGLHVKQGLWELWLNNRYPEKFLSFYVK